jgi:hypothetical protein
MVQGFDFEDVELLLEVVGSKQKEGYVRRSLRVPALAASASSRTALRIAWFGMSVRVMMVAG